MRIRREVLPFLGMTVAAGLACSLAFDNPEPVYLVTAFAAGFVVFFFRDPERKPPTEEDAIVSGADGRVMSVSYHKSSEPLDALSVRISVFLSLFDVHVNRAPLAGQSMFLGYYPGKTLFAFREKSSDVNQHNKILITGTHTKSLVVQLVGLFARRVVYWPAHDRSVAVRAGDRIGMMKFGSRLDVYLPAADVEVLVKRGDRVRAGETVIAKLRNVDVRSEEG